MKIFIIKIEIYVGTVTTLLEKNVIIARSVKKDNNKKNYKLLTLRIIKIITKRKQKLLNLWIIIIEPLSKDFQTVVNLF